MNNKILLIIFTIFLFSFFYKKFYRKKILLLYYFFISYIEKISSLLKYHYKSLLYNDNILNNDDIKIISLSKYYFVSFGGPTQNYYNALNRIHKQINNLTIFDYNIKYTDNDLKNDIKFWERHGEFIKNNKRGYGYWLWKPYIILQTLNKMQNDDILLYADAGCEIINDSKKMKHLFEKCCKYDILYTSTYHKERRWTKRDLLNYMNMDSPMFIDNLQSQASFIFLKKNNKIYNFINEWYNIASNHYNFIDDSPSVLQNHYDFVENRHDQSIFSLLTKKYNMNNENNILHEHKPIIIARNR